MSNREYILGTNDDELNRLGLQHQLWRAQAYSIWERAQFGPGKTLLDAGCGPGFGTADLSALVGARGKVTAIDVSDKFVARVRALDLPNVDTRVADLQSVGEHLPGDHFDGAYCRWVLCFVSDPQRVIDAIAKSLKRGGCLAIQDYYNYRAIKVAPRSEAFERVIRAVAESWQQNGGDCDIGCRLPTMLQSAGLKVTYLQPILRLARAGDSLWQWPTTFFRIFIPSLIKMGFLTDADQQSFERDWAARTADPNAFFTSPPMIEIIAVKP